MTVSELISALERMPKDSQVYYPYDGYMWEGPVSWIWLSKRGQVVLAGPYEPIYDPADRPIDSPPSDDPDWFYEDEYPAEVPVDEALD